MGAVIASPRSKADLAALLREGDVLSLCALASSLRGPHRSGFREDGALLLVDPQGEREPTRPPEGSARRTKPPLREVHVLGEVDDLGTRFPGLWVHAAEPLPEADSLGFFTGRAEEPGGEWERLADLPHPKVAAATYGPDTPPEALAARLDRLRSVRNLRSMVWLPAWPGDLQFLPGRTTDGTADAALLAVTRLALPPEVHVRASWAAYGWKLAQVALAFGADEVAGWGLEEEMAWGPGVEPASVVSREEAEAGIREALGNPVEVRGCAWES